MLTPLRFIVAALCLLLSTNIFAQSMNSAIIEGTVKDSNGNPIAGVTVVAIHQPSGTQYGTTSRDNGHYNLPGVRIGGPYKVVATSVGYGEQHADSIFLSLNQDFIGNFTLTGAVEELQGVTVTATNTGIFNSARTGASANISTAQINTLPTITRNLADFTRLTPQANTNIGSQLSFAGRSDKFNNLTVDGALFNNAFGLASTIGGQTNAQPIALDAIEQVSVDIAPFDVRSGSFTGATINAVTRSGTNTFSGSAYSYFNNQGLQGNKVNGTELTNPTFNDVIAGLRLGGPIVKNKIFFFVNGEIERKSTPATNYIASTPENQGGVNVSEASASELDSLAAFLKAQYGYDPGPYQDYNLLIHSDKITARIDWNLTEKSKFNIKYNFLNSYQDVPPSNSGSIGGSRQPSNTALPFAASNYRIHNNMNSFIAELNTNISSTLSNNATIGYSALRDYRESTGGEFPLVDIGNGSGSSLTTFGYEPFSANNLLNTDVFQFSDNLTMYKGKHEITVGTYNEIYAFKNGFSPNYFGAYQFSSLSDFYSNATQTPGAGDSIAIPLQYQLSYSAVPGGEFPFAKMSCAEFGLYAQDRFYATPQLRITAGLRADLPVIFSTPDDNPQADTLSFRDGQMINTSKVPSPYVMLSPRVGFNWDVQGNGKTQLRGGTGIFSGRVPFVWVSNQFSNTGTLFGSLLYKNTSAAPFNTSAVPFNPDVTAYIPENATASSTYGLAITDEQFRYPQVWRTNLGFDQELPWGIIGTIELEYTKDLNAILLQNINLPNSSVNAAGADNRPIFYHTDSLGHPTSPYNRINSNITNAMLITNSNKGYSYFATLQLQKTISKTLYLMLAYTYADARDANSGNSSIASSNWQFRQVSGDPNADVLSYSDYLQRNRIVGAATYTKEYGGHFATSIGLYYSGGPGPRYSYTYSGDMNGDALSTNDLVYIPKNQSEINLLDITGTSGGQSYTYTAAQQWTDLNNYIAQDPYLSEHRGEYAARNGLVAPWRSRIDLHIAEHFYIDTKSGSRNTLEITGNLLNVANLFSSKSGLIQIPNRTSLLTFKGYNGNGEPTFTFPYLNSGTQTPLSESFTYGTALSTLWQVQLGLRYTFN